MSLSPQNALMLRLVRQGPVHSHDLRAIHSIGDPAKRACELRDAGYDVRSQLARRNGRHGVLYFTAADEPAGLGGAAPSASGHSPRPSLTPEPSGTISSAVTDHEQRRCFLVPPHPYTEAPEPGCVWVVDCYPDSPFYGRSYWRSEARVEAVAQAVAA